MGTIGSGVHQVLQESDFLGCQLGKEWQMAQKVGQRVLLRGFTKDVAPDRVHNTLAKTLLLLFKAGEDFFGKRLVDLEIFKGYQQVPLPGGAAYGLRETDRQVEAFGFFISNFDKVVNTAIRTGDFDAFQ